MGMIINPFWGLAGDPNWTSVKLLLGFEGADASTTFTDESSAAKTCTAIGNGQIDTAQFKFGASSYLGDGTGDACRAGGATDADFNSNNNATPWTFEGFVRFNSTAGDQAIFGKWNPPTTGYLLRMTGGSLDWLNFFGTNISFAGWSPGTGTWFHVCVDYNGTKCRIYTDGVMRASATANQKLSDTVQNFAVGAQSGGAGRSFNGWIDEFRYTNGIARYDSDSGYTVPAAAYPRS